MFDVSKDFVDGQGSDRTGIYAESLLALQTLQYLDIGQFLIINDPDPALPAVEISIMGERTDQLTT
jgi:hypothetical protein